MGNISEDIGRICYLEPTDLVNSIDRNGNTVDNTVWYNEDLTMEVDLKVVRGDRNDCGKSIDINSVIVSKNSPFVSFFGGAKIGNNEYLSTDYVTAGYQEIKAGVIGNRECIGMKDIDIRFDENFYPEVTITFTDIRGLGLMLPSELEYSDERSIDNLFGALFHFPYPRFLLTLKGFYGTKVTFMLSAMDFKASLNSSNGNFDITVKFNGYINGVYTDIPFNFLLVAPYFNENGGDNNTTCEYWNKRISDGVFVYRGDNDNSDIKQEDINNGKENAQNEEDNEDSHKIKSGNIGGGAMITFIDFLKVYNDIGLNMKRLGNDSEEAGKLNEIEGILGKINACQNAYGAVITDLRKRFEKVKWNAKGNSVGEDFTDDNGNRYCKILFYNPTDVANDENTLSNIDLLKNLYETCNSLNSVFDLPESLKHNTELSNNFIQFKVEQKNIKSDSLDSDTLKFLGDEFSTEYEYLDSFDFYITPNMLSGKKTELNEQKKDVEGKDDEKLAKLAAQALGFKPTVENFFRMAYAHLDCFMHHYYTLLDVIANKKNTGERSVKSLGIDIIYTDLDRFASEETFVPPFTGFYKKNDENGTNELIYPSDIVGLDELNFVEKFMESSKTVAIQGQKFIEDSLRMGEGKGGDTDGEYELGFIPTAIEDIRLNGENPYLSINTNNPEQWGNVLYTFLHRFKAGMLTNSRYSMDSDSWIDLCKVEAYNFYKVHRTNVSSFIPEDLTVENLFGFLKEYDDKTQKKVLSGEEVVYDKNSSSKTYLKCCGNEIDVPYNGDTIRFEPKFEGRNVTKNTISVIDEFCGENGVGGNSENGLGLSTSLNNSENFGNSGEEFELKPYDNNYDYNRGESLDKIICKIYSDTGIQNAVNSDSEWESIYKEKKWSSYYIPTVPGIGNDGNMFLNENAISISGVNTEFNGYSNNFYNGNSMNINGMEVGDVNVYINFIIQFLGTLPITINSMEFIRGCTIDTNSFMKNIWYLSALYYGAIIWKRDNYDNFLSGLKKVHRNKPDNFAGKNSLLKSTNESFNINKNGGVENFLENIVIPDEVATFFKKTFADFCNHSGKDLIKEIISLWKGDNELVTVTFNGRDTTFYKFKQEQSDKLIEFLLSRNTLIHVRAVNSGKKNAKDVITEFFNQVKLFVDKGSSDQTSQESSLSNAEKANPSKNHKLTMYQSFKNLYDKWLSSYSRDNFKLTDPKTTLEHRKKRYVEYEDVSDDSEFNNYVFVDSFFNDISNDMLINPLHVYTTIVDHLNAEENFGFHHFLETICTRSKFLFRVFPVYNGFYDKNTLKEIFTPHNFHGLTHSESKKHTQIGYTYMVAYPHEVSHNANFDNSDVNDDGIYFTDKKGARTNLDMFSAQNPDSDKINFKVPAIGVTYGIQNQSYFTNISVNMDQAKVTDASLMALNGMMAYSREMSINMGATNSQDIFSVYSNRSYTCTVEMLGCMNIMPMMYFQLNNIPLFNGAYIITSVRHSISSGKFKTIFQGVRVSRVIMPMNKTILELGVIQDILENRYKRYAVTQSGGGSSGSVKWTGEGNLPQDASDEEKALFNALVETISISNTKPPIWLLMGVVFHEMGGSFKMSLTGPWKHHTQGNNGATYCEPWNLDITESYHNEYEKEDTFTGRGRVYLDNYFKTRLEWAKKRVKDVNDEITLACAYHFYHIGFTQFPKVDNCTRDDIKTFFRGESVQGITCPATARNGATTTMLFMERYTNAKFWNDDEFIYVSKSQGTYSTKALLKLQGVPDDRVKWI